MLCVEAHPAKHPQPTGQETILWGSPATLYLYICVHVKKRLFSWEISKSQEACWGPNGEKLCLKHLKTSNFLSLRNSRIVVGGARSGRKRSSSNAIHGATTWPKPIWWASMKWHSSLVAFHGKSPRYFTTASAWPWHKMNPTMVLSSFGLNSFSSASAWIGDSSRSSFNSTHGFGRLRCSQQSESASCVLHKVLQLASCSSNWSASFRSCNAKCAAATEPSSRQGPCVMEANKESLAG